MNNKNENTQRAAEEDWAMSEPDFHLTQMVGAKTVNETAETVSDGETEDWTVTPIAPTPAEKKNDGWQMPPPVFRVSSGTTPEKSDRTKPRSALPADQPANSEKTAESADVQPQPFISEDLIIGDIIEKPPAKAEGKTSKGVFIIVGLIAMLIFAVAFLIGIYFLFFYKTDV